jgi:hypothetical protein
MLREAEPATIRRRFSRASDVRCTIIEFFRCSNPVAIAKIPAGASPAAGAGAGTCNLDIRYGQMTMALVAQAAIDQLRKPLAPPATNRDAKLMATADFAGLERVK